ncbi:Nif3-like dinuclear metal center hexameric protein [Acutalibacter sp. 1XD8-33]|uniref:Nif3-like dinuclear metal center hexameric protein n=1 Tax=Acutalibacter sp. 1XD8-33 TaxID=2320081 RepID=UPI000EA2DBC4|nr:Nif3-like dinuclear metal center hexameric protein [Acutalibacter sp. 1XD8-33]RKJ40941.1 Nif3-like dinuclear metal center hexameric protein [Acutalibacter sp. 1XD8-33]
MARICDIYDIINAVAPFESQMAFDNSGLLVGDGATEVTRALLCLDITGAVVEEASAINANLIISHHPVIFDPLKALNSRSPAYLLAKNGIAALCCHTNLDRSPVCGVNVALAAKIGLRSVHPEDVFGEEFILFAGELERETEPREFARLVKDRLGAGTVQLIDGGRPVKKVFLCSGAGGEGPALAACRGADAYLTGEMKQHEALEAAKTGLSCVVAGHYETEIVFAEFLAAYLKKRIPDTAFLISKAEKPPFTAV